MGKEGNQPGDVDVRCRCIRVEGGSAQVPLGCVAVETLALKEIGDGHSVGGRSRHCPRVWENANGAVGGDQQQTCVGRGGGIK